MYIHKTAQSFIILFIYMTFPGLEITLKKLGYLVDSGF